MKLLTILLLLMISGRFQSRAQQPVVIGIQDSIYSRTLKEYRQIWIGLPESYNANTAYPVVYVLDGDAFFTFFTGMVRHLANAAMIPEMIVVGIGNTNRFRDLTPDYDSLHEIQPNGGGGQFVAFLDKELIPHIEKRYRVAPYRLLMGHSLGGLLAAYVFYKHTTLFDAYLLPDPSVWWKKMALIRSPLALTDRRFNNKALFLAQSNAVQPGIADTAAMRKDTTNATIGPRSVFDWRDRLNQGHNDQFRFSFKYYPDETHGSLPLISSYDGLRFLFDFYKRPSFPVLTDSTVVMLGKHYERISERMHYRILPTESDLSGLAWRSAVLDHNLPRAKIFLDMHLALYPESVLAMDNMAAYHQETGDTANAKIYHEKANALRSAIH